MSTDVYQRLQKLCEANNVSVTSLCVEVTGSKGNLQTWKKGNIRMDYLISIAEKFNSSVDYLLGRTDDPLGGIADDVTEDLVIYNRNGKVIRKKMSKDAMRLLTSMLDALPEDDNPDL